MGGFGCGYITKFMETMRDSSIIIVNDKGVVRLWNYEAFFFT